MKILFDDSVKNLIKTAYFNEKDIFIRAYDTVLTDFSFDENPAAVLLPSDFSFSDGGAFSDYSEGALYSEAATENNIVFADIRFMAEGDFRQFLSVRRIRRLIVPFAECALKGEYLFRQAYGWIGEFRAECPYYIQIVALCAPCDTDFNKLLEIFGCKEAISIGESKEPSLKIYETASAESKLYYTANEAEKYAHKKTVIYFNSRNEATAFRRFLNARKTQCIYFDGSLSQKEKRKALKTFIDGEIPVMVATRSVIREGISAEADRCIFSGIPFSVAHLMRCCNGFSECTVIYCKADYERNEKISLSLADKTGDGEIYTERMKRLSEIKQILQREK